MSISIDIPDDLEQSLRQQVADLDREAKEAVLVELYRRERLTHAQFARALGVSRMKADEVLKRHKVYYDLTAEDVAREAEGLRRLRTDDADRR